jgi:hypothetical protein
MPPHVTRLRLASLEISKSRTFLKVVRKVYTYFPQCIRGFSVPKFLKKVGITIIAIAGITQWVEM